MEASLARFALKLRGPRVSLHGVPGVFEVGDLPEKSAVRSSLVSVVKRRFQQHTGRLAFLVLPGPWWNFERKVARWSKGRRDRSRRPWRPVFVGCERDRTLFQLAAQHMNTSERRGLKCSHNAELGGCDVVTNSRDAVLLHADVHDYIATTRRRFHVVFLDFTAPYSRRLEASLARMDAITEAQAFVFVTLTAAREVRDVADELATYPSRELFLQEKFAKLLGVRFEPFLIGRHCDRTPMITLGFTAGA